MHEKLSDEQVKALGTIVEKYYERAKNDVHPTYSDNSMTRVDKYARDKTYKKQDCVRISDLAAGHIYIMIEGTKTGAILTYVGISTSPKFSGMGTRHVFLDEASHEVCYEISEYVDYLPIKKLLSVPILGATDGT